VKLSQLKFLGSRFFAAGAKFNYFCE